MRIGLAQINPIIGDLEGNFALITQCIEQAKKTQCDLVVFSEMALLGYPPRDLLLVPELINQHNKILKRLAAMSETKLSLIVGGVKSLSNGGLLNGAHIFSNKKIVAFVGKKLLPNYDVFDETRYFETYTGSQVIEIKGHKIGVTICEDIWNLAGFSKRQYGLDPVKDIKKQKAEIIINLSASPFEIGKDALRSRLLSTQAKKCKLPIVYVNQTGGNDELIFDGASMVVNAKGVIALKAKSFASDFVVWDSESPSQKIQKTASALQNLESALILGVQDYVRKCGFNKVVLGLSGGIDSALVAHIAVKALGPNNVLGLLMPSRYTSAASNEDALELANNLKISTRTIAIDSIQKSFEDEFNLLFKGLPADTTEENIQARIRGNILMAVSNKENFLVLSTGNKSELSVGYCTLYGDMAGGLAVIADVPKTMVYQLARWMNQEIQSIPERTFTKAPTAELKPNQTDQDSLPPYEILDKILHWMIHDHLSDAQMVKKGMKAQMVGRIRQMVQRNEYKRRQAAPGLKVTSRAFGAGRRFPIARL